MMRTPKAEQKNIVIAGLRNAGKSSLMNRLFGHEVSIVSAIAGTTTDPVSRSFELGALGPVSIVDTAGFDDSGELGELRKKKSQDRFDRADVIIFATRIDDRLQLAESEFLARLKSRGVPVIIALTFADFPVSHEKAFEIAAFPAIKVNNMNGAGILELRELLIVVAKTVAPELTPVEGLVSEHDFVVLVTPIDLAAPKGRLILPQVETIRDLLDRDCGVLVVKERELSYFYNALKVKPKLVITDSQAFHKVAADIPPEQPLTSFSILFARKKGDLSFFVEGVGALNSIERGSKVLVLEACAHHTQADDIGTVKIPRLFKQLVEAQTTFEFARELPPDETLSGYSTVICCAGCMVTRKTVMDRIGAMKRLEIPGMNYGLFLAWANGLLPRALEPFPYEYEQYLRFEKD